MSLQINVLTAVGIALIMLFTGCGMSNQAVKQEHNRIIALEKKKHRLERDYHIVLSHLEKHPNARELRLKKAELQKGIIETGLKIKESRQQLEMAVQQWEERVLSNRIEQNMVDEENRRHPPQSGY